MSHTVGDKGGATICGDTAIPEFRVYPGDRVREVLEHNREAVVDAVEGAYLAHAAGHTVNPDSCFLRFEDRAADRIIALPASYIASPGTAITGIKWISSFPSNGERGLARASAVLILNDEATGYPVACMEAGSISATRTAASAMIALRALCGGRCEAKSIAIVGTGVLSGYVLSFLAYAGADPEQILLFDIEPEHAQRFAQSLHTTLSSSILVGSSIEEVVSASDVVIFATTARAPHVHEAGLFAHAPVVLHLSLRDLGSEVILSAYNVVDDVDHSLKARTSLHLTEMRVSNRDFVTCTLPQLLGGAPVPSRDRPRIFSPFGMGILDIALGDLVHRALVAETEPVNAFFDNPSRYWTK